MQKIVINRCHGGFSLSVKGVKHYAKLKGITLYAFVRASYDNNTFKQITARSLKDGEHVYYASKPLKADGTYDSYFDPVSIPRDDPALVRTVEELGKKANGTYAELVVVEIPDGVVWGIDEYAGAEVIYEEHRRWS
jgi:hypothetical protein